MNRAIILFLLSLLLVGCITPLERYRYRNVYRRLIEQPDEVDPIGLKGKVIVLDPGHGGPATGAVGLNGLTEKEVNLGVAKHLKEMLASAGAVVILTREADSRVVKDEKAGNKEDLKARVQISNENKADLFISLHHNSDILAGSKKNQIETYYAIQQGDASLDLARHIHQHLVKNLGIKENRIIPSNFFVLRENKAISVLLEPSYLSNEYVEYRLKDDEARWLEAAAIYIGIAEYLSKGVPKITKVWPDNETISTAHPQIEAWIKDDPFGPGIVPSTVRMELDNRVVEAHFDSKRGLISYTPEMPLENGIHTIRVYARNYNGNASRATVTRFTVDLPPEMIEVIPALPAIPSNCRLPLSLEIVLKDRHGHLVNDGREVEIKVDKGEVHPAMDKTKNGKVIAYVTPGGGDVNVTIRSGKIEKKFYWPAQRVERSIAILYLKNNLTKEPVEGAKILLGKRSYISNKDGYLLVEDPGTEGMIEKEGYLSQTVGFSPDRSTYQINLKPAFDGILFNKVVAIDPEYRGMESGTIDPGSIREADINLEVARFLAGYLRQAGAKPFMTREDDITLSPHERLLKIEDSGADILVIIGHSYSNLAYTEHYPGSKKGKNLASSIHQFIKGNNSGGIRPTGRYLVAQTSMPAVYVHLANLKDRDPAYLRSKAYQIFSGILGYYLGLKREGFYEISGVVKDSEGRPIENAVIILNNTFQIQTTKGGRYHLYIPRSPLGDTYSLFFAKTGYQPREVKVKTEESSGEEMEVVLEKWNY